MIDRKAFFDHVRQHLFGGSINQSQVDGLNSLLDAWEKDYSDRDLRWLAYCLATAHHETARTMQPIEEYGKGANYPYGKRIAQSGASYSDTNAIFYGRGYVQLTWRENYLKAGSKLGHDFLQHPELVMVPENAARILFEGMQDGWFTGRKLSDYFNDRGEDWYNARRIINGLDRAALVADYGRGYYAALG